MPDEPPRYFTLINLIVELFHVGVISACCYAGWVLTGHVLGLFVGGAFGRFVWLVSLTWLLSKAERDPAE